MTTALDIVTGALQEMGALAQGEQASPADADSAFKRLNRMLDSWNAERRYVLTTRQDIFTLVGGLSPHTIGPTGATFTYAGARPIEVISAQFIYAGSPAVFTPLNLRDDQWWAAQTVPGLQSAIPTDLYYDPSWPNGSLFFWPVPSASGQVQLETLQRLEKLGSLNSPFSLSPGYEDAVTLSLAEVLCPSFGRGVDPELARQARDARARVQSINARIPRLNGADAGAGGDGGGSRRPDYNYMTGKVG